MIDFFDHFDNSYVLTFKKAKDRQESVKEKLLGCKYEFFEGYDKDDLSQDLKNESNNPFSRRNRYYPYPFLITDGQLACAMGHLEIYRKIIANNYSNVLILEDDIVPEESALMEFSEMIGEVPEDADLIYWGYEINAWPQSNTLKNLFIDHLKLATLKLRGRKGMYLHAFPVTTFNAIRSIYFRKHSKYFYKSGAHWGTHAYSISKRGAEILLNLQTPLCFEADHLLIYAIMNKHLKAYLSVKQVFLQDKHTHNPQLDNYILEH